MYSEEQLIILLQDQDDQAMQVLYDQYAPALYGVVLRIVQSEEVAEDVMQDAFVKIWRYGRRYNSSKGSLFTWMLNIARNTAIDHIRSAYHRNHQKKQSIETAYGLSQQFNVNHIGVSNIVNNLDEKYRQVIDLIYFQGYTQKEVEDELKIPLGTVKSRVRIALREMRKIFLTKMVVFLIMLSLLFQNTL